MQLERHVWRLGKRVDDLVQHLRVHESSALSLLEEYQVERAIIQLQIEWEHFVRSLILDSAVGLHSTRSGLVKSNLAVRLRSREHASRVLISQYNKRRHEPDWYLPQDAIVAAGKLALTNENQIATELGVTPWELDDLRHLRNFIAHRSSRSALSVRAAANINKSNRIVPSSMCFAYGTGGVRKYESWAVFMKGVANRLVA